MKLTELGVSQREAYERCPAYWYNAYVMGEKGIGIVPARTSRALDFGSIGHKGLQTWYGLLQGGMPPDQAVEPSIAAMRAFREGKIAAWDESNGVVSERSEEDVGVLTVEGFLKGYAEWYREDSLWEIVRAEWDFTLAATDFYPSTLATPEKSALPAIRGTVDLIVRRPEGLVVIDHKFHKWIDLELESVKSYWKQPLVYCRAVELVWGEPVVGYIHNQIRKPVGLKPRFDSKTGAYESYDDFLKRLSDEFVLFPDYTATYKANKKGYFARSDLMEFDVHDTRFLSEMAWLDYEMAHKRESLPDRVAFSQPLPIIQRRSPKVACKMYGQLCEYHPLCAYGYNPSTLENFVERSEPHP